MPLIKRYPNRKLYDTESKQYITLEGIAELLRNGEDVTVIDHASGEDLTALTLTQIIVEQEKKQSGSLPRSVLAGLIRTGGDKLSAIQKSLAYPFNFLYQFEEEIKRRISMLVNRGELSEGEGNNLLDKLTNRDYFSGRNLQAIDDYIEQQISERNLPSREDIQQLNKQLEEITAKLDNL